MTTTETTLDTQIRSLQKQLIRLRIKKAEELEKKLITLFVRPPDKVYFFHLNNSEKLRKYDLSGGTVVVVRSGGRLYTGVSLCSGKDQFSKRKGRMLALKRALRDENLGIYSHDVTDIVKIREIADETFAYAVKSKLENLPL